MLFHSISETLLYQGLDEFIEQRTPSPTCTADECCGRQTTNGARGDGTTCTAGLGRSAERVRFEFNCEEGLGDWLELGPDAAQHGWGQGHMSEKEEKE